MEDCMKKIKYLCGIMMPTSFSDSLNLDLAWNATLLYLEESV